MICEKRVGGNCIQNDGWKTNKKKRHGQDLFLIFERFFGGEAHVDSNAIRSEMPQRQGFMCVSPPDSWTPVRWSVALPASPFW
jgi:hypothetical protein